MELSDDASYKAQVSGNSGDGIYQAGHPLNKVLLAPLMDHDISF